MKVAIWTERFFPEIGGLEKSMKNLAIELEMQGFIVDVITKNGKSIIDGINIINLGENNFLVNSSNYLISNHKNYEVLYISRIFQEKETEHLRFIDEISNYKCILLRIPTTFNVNHLRSLDINNVIESKINFLIAQNQESLAQCRKLFPKQHSILSKNRTYPPKNINVTSQKTFLFSGRITESKNLHTLLDAWSIINDIITDNTEQIKLIIYGINYENGYFQKCVKKIDKLNNVKYCGSYVPDDLSIIDKSYFVIIPSLKEGHCNLALEALSCGTPIIASNIPGLSDDLSYLENYILQDQLNPKELANKLISAINLPYEEYKSLVRNIRNRSLVMNSIKSKQIELIKLIQICFERDFSILIIKPESINMLQQTYTFLENYGFNILDSGDKSDWSQFVKSFYLDFNTQQHCDYFKAYNSNNFGFDYHFVILEHSEGNTLSRLTNLKGPYFSNIETNNEISLRALYGLSDKYNFVSQGKTIVFNGFHCPRTQSELIHTLLFLNITEIEKKLSTTMCHMSLGG